MPCLIKSDMHHTCLCIMTCLCLCVYYVVCFFPGCFSRWPSVSFRSCEDSFDYVRLSSSWTRSSSLRDLRQDDHTLEITSIFAWLVVRSIAMLALPTTWYIMPPILPCQASNPPFLANRCLAMLPVLLSPSYSVVSCRWRWRLLHVGLCLCWDITISLI